MREYVGVIHLHTEYSDGWGTYEQIMKTAKEVGLDFVIGTDHDTIQPKLDGLEGYHNGVLLICGYEITPEINHYLAIGTDKLIPPSDNPQDYIDDVRESGGLGVIAHPHHIGIKRFGVDAFPWNDWSVNGYDAMSIWDLVNDWGENINGYVSGLQGLINPAGYINGPNPKTLHLWDELNRERLVAGIGELDNHNTHFKVFGITVEVFKWEFALKTIRNHLLIDDITGDYERDTKHIIDVIKRGRLFVANDYFENSRGFEFFALLDGGKRAYMGERLPAGTKMNLFINSPKKAYILLFHNSNLVKEKYSTNLTYATDKSGVWRAEVHLQKGLWRRGWIYSNPITIEGNY